MSALFPEGVSSIHEAPYTWHDAVLAALTFLKYEELPREEQPPKRIWLDGDRMKEWSSTVERNREQRYKGNAPTGPMSENAAAEGLIVG